MSLYEFPYKPLDSTSFLSFRLNKYKPVVKNESVDLLSFAQSRRYAINIILEGKRRLRNVLYACGYFFSMPRSLVLPDLERKSQKISRLINVNMSEYVCGLS